MVNGWVNRAYGLRPAVRARLIIERAKEMHKIRENWA